MYQHATSPLGHLRFARADDGQLGLGVVLHSGDWLH